MKKVISGLIATLQLQLFLNIISLLIIAHWGLTLSYLAPLSNIIFSPLLTAFLLLSSLIFFFELLHIPNEWLIYLLELLTQAWSKIMALAGRSYIMSLSKPPIVVTICTLFATAAILQSIYFKSPVRRLAGFTTILTILFVYLGFTQVPRYDIKTVTLNHKTVTVIHSRGTLVVIDHGAFAQLGASKSWLEFTFLPFLRQTYATDIISHLVIPRPTIKTLQTVSDLCDCADIKNVYLPLWQGTQPRGLTRGFMGIKEKLANGGTLHRIGYKKIHITLNRHSWLNIAPQKERDSYKEITFAKLSVTCMLDGTKYNVPPVTDGTLRK